MNCNITKTTIDGQKPLILEYLDTLTCVVDDYWEEHVMKADCYKIIIEQNEIGCFTIYHNEKITMFYMKPEYYTLAQPIFKQILEDYTVKSAYVTTGDQLFLSLCLDYHSKIELQAYFFDGSEMREVRPAEYPRSSLYRVEPSELGEVLERTGDFFQPITSAQLETEEILLYKLCEDAVVLGYGIIVPNKLATRYWPCGMITLEENRRKGIGRSIQQHLGDICRENGFIPISGCWYYNHLSKKTIESAGRFTKTRLLNVIF
jgi:GNAT superfamily N-acetyltransferase